MPERTFASFLHGICINAKSESNSSRFIHFITKNCLNSDLYLRHISYTIIRVTAPSIRLDC